MYGIAGERELPERELPNLPGYAGSTPVRIGNGAYTQYQGDVFGEVLAACTTPASSGVEENADSWALQRALLGYVEEHWQEPDNGIWEMRGPRRHFTHSRAMIWAAFDRGSPPSRSSASKVPSSAGAPSAPPSARRSRSTAGTPTAAATGSTTTPTRSTRACSSCRRSAT